jgi:hypothetical protein
MLRILTSWSCVLLSTVSAHAAEFFAAPDGSPHGNGSAEAPWDLATALAGPEAVQPGDTIWLMPGAYRGGFVSRLKGRPDAPIVVRGVRDGRVTIDTHPRDDRDNGFFLLQGADAVFRDFEVTCSHPQRVTEIGGSWPADIRRGAVDVRGDRLSLINLVVHDCANGFGFWSEGEGGEISGCLIYNNGWQGPDRGHGHAIYAQNERGVKRMTDNVIFHQFAYGIHVYGSEKASLKGFHIEGNIAFENGCLARGEGGAPGIMVGGGSPAERVVVRENLVIGGGMRMGYPWGVANEDVSIVGNYIEGSLVVRDFRTATVTGNVVVAHSNPVQLEAAAQSMLEGLTWDENEYFVTDGRWGETAVVEKSKSRALPFEQWRRETGCDRNSRFTKGAPTELRVIVRPNPHEPGRAHIAVLNPQLLPEVEVDLSGVLAIGQRFRIASVKDYYGHPLANGVYQGGALRIPMKAVAAPPPVGLSDATLPVTEPAFAAFVVLAE